MGAATSITSGGWFFAEAVDVVLVLNDARNIALLEREELSALVHLNPDDSGRFILTRESPASLSLTSTKIVVIEFQGIIQGQQDSARCLGEVILPVHHIARQCAGSLYQVWLPLQPASALLREDDHIDHFEKALLKSARDPRRPMVCLSLYAGSIPQASRNYLFDASEKEKAARVLGLMQSYSQHARMLQALYREVRSSQASAQLDTSGLADSWPSRRPEMGSPVAEFSPEASRDADKADASPTDVRAAVREEIRETQAEADERLRKADKTIQALRGMINDKQVELIQRRKEVSRLKHEAESLQLENEKLEVQLSRSSLRGVTAADSVEAANLEKEAEELKTQKEALLVLRRDFYRAMGQEPPSLAAMVSKHQADARQEPRARNKVVEPDKATECEHAAPVVQEWTNMLPRPSELLLSGLEERFANDN